MTDGCPAHLYKYLAPERIEVLQHAMLRYTPLGAFNDPFEGRPGITVLSTDEAVLKVFAEILPEEARKAYDELPPKARSAISVDQFFGWVARMADVKKAELLERFRELTPFAKWLLHRRFDEHLGALCLAEVPDSLLMWSHYAVSHTGYVIEFDAHHLYFHEKRSPEDEFRHLRRVLYRETRPNAPLNELDGPDLFLIKSGHWAYEREWRIIRPLRDAQAVVPAEPFSVHLFSFPRAAVKSVILGSRMTPTVENRLMDVLQSHREYTSVQVKRARPDETHFFLRIDGVPM